MSTDNPLTVPCGSQPWGADPAVRPVGLETEFGVLEPGNVYANPVALASQVVAAYGAVSRDGEAVRWDYEAEDPLADLRGGRLDRAAAHPSQLTDDPTALAPSGDEMSDAVGPLPPAQGSSLPPAQGSSLPPAPWGTRPRPTAAEAALPRATTAVLTNGARLYVDHAHPEYSSPEVATPLDAVTWDRAGEVIARRAMDALAAERAQAGEPGGQVVLYKNNVDGKGAAYGSHESYLVRRDLPFADLAAALIPFLVTRPVLAGAGRVGIGQRSQVAGFQLSQRADYVETDIGLQTTFNRPIVNTRDEPHAEATRWRRLHVINGDANQLDTPIYLKVATTNLLLWYLERAAARGEGSGALADLALSADPVEEHWALSHDTTLAYRLATVSGPMTGLEIQRAVLDAVRAAMEEDGLLEATSAQARSGVTAQADAAAHRRPCPSPHAGGRAPHAIAALRVWDEVLGALETYAAACASGDQAARATALAAAGRDVEWAAKLTLVEGLRRRTGAGWDDPRLAALDIQWADLRAGTGLAHKVIAAGRTRRLVTDDAVTAAADQPPTGTRAWVRGQAVARLPQVVGASWTSLVLDLPGHDRLVRAELPGDVVCPPEAAQGLLAQLTELAGPAGKTQ